MALIVVTLLIVGTVDIGGAVLVWLTLKCLTWVERRIIEAELKRSNFPTLPPRAQHGAADFSESGERRT